MEKLKELTARILGVRENEISSESSPETIDSWDSFNALMLVSELESNFDVKFSSEEIIAVKKFEDIVMALKSHGVSEEALYGTK